jgi:hypothetical protein
MMITDCYHRYIPTHLCPGGFVGPDQSYVPTELTHIMSAKIVGCENYAEHQSWIDNEVEKFVYFWQKKRA